MSNCCKLYQGNVALQAKAFNDLDGFKKLVDWSLAQKHSPLHQIKDADLLTDNDRALNTVYWFLSDNVEFGYIHNDEEWVLIDFGEGRSGHTFRDLRATVGTIGRYLDPDYKSSHDFRAADTDGNGPNAQPQKFVLTFQNNPVYPKPILP